MENYKLCAMSYPTEFIMRKLVLSIAAIALMAPGTALACGHGQTSSVTVSCEQGVRVYRAAPMAAPAVPVVIVQRNNGFAQERAALQSERLAAQADRIDALENQLERRNNPQRIRRGFSAPVGAFGAAPFVGRRGFKNRRNPGIRVRFDRRIRS